MKNISVLLGVMIVLSQAIVVHARSNELKGTWELENAEINLLLENGTSELVRVLTSSEIEEKSIPVSISFTGDQLNIVAQNKKIQSSFSFDENRAIQKITHQNYVFTLWLSGEDELILVAEYRNDDYQGNELRIIYRRK